MNYPLQLRFKLFALAPQIYVQDATGADVCYVKQKLFRLREKVEVYTNSSRQQLLCTIAADRVIDFSANYNFRTPDGRPIGSVRRRGLRSIWKAHYQVLDGAGQPEFEIHEINPFAKVMDSIIGEIPILGMFSGFFFNPKYAVTQNGNQVLTMTKHRSFLESKFTIDQTSPVQPQDELRLVLSLLMFVLMERKRG